MKSINLNINIISLKFLSNNLLPRFFNDFFSFLRLCLLYQILIELRNIIVNCLCVNLFLCASNDMIVHSLNVPGLMNLMNTNWWDIVLFVQTLKSLLSESLASCYSLWSLAFLFRCGVRTIGFCFILSFKLLLFYLFNLLLFLHS